jgi:hypothetical protein
MRYFLLVTFFSILLGLWIGLHSTGRRIDLMLLDLADKFYPKESLPSFIINCYSDSDCQWVITNCCPETAGAYWECKNVKSFRPPKCPPEGVICPQVLSPKPAKGLCFCKEGRCIT